jgi:glutathione-specific gamma-glutamylcyclotransferase
LLWLLLSSRLYVVVLSLASAPWTARRMTTGSSDTSTSIRSVQWDPVQQIYVGGVMPGATDEEIGQLLEQDGVLRVFGYGSLCWNPGDGVLGEASATTGRLYQYRRVWAQRSTDHRGTPSFPGLVCTLLQCCDLNNTSSVTQGRIYTVPRDKAEECWKELDIREKGGYAREIVVVEEEETGQQVSALLYRGTPDNPAFWSLALQDLALAAAVMTVATGPSGPNHVYVQQLDHFLQQHTQTTGNQGTPPQEDDTRPLAKMIAQLQQHNKALYFLYGCGSNQHGQIRQHNNNHHANDDEDIPHLLESVLCCGLPQDDNHFHDATTCIATTDHVDPPLQLVAGGGHSGLITTSGQLFLWGWNDQGQCGTYSSTNNTNHHHNDTNNNPPYPFLPVRHAIANLRVAKTALGFSHSLVIEKETHQLYAWGDNSHGQCILGDNDPKNCIGKSATTMTVDEPTLVFPHDTFLACGAGVFHSAAITTRGQLVTWGSDKHAQCLARNHWMPPDGSRLEQVVCGRHHTAVVDDEGRIWTLGDNQYGQLARTIPIFDDTNNNNNNNNNNSSSRKRKNCDSVPRLVDGPLGRDHNGTWRCLELKSGWSHLVARVQQIVSSDDTSTTPNESVAVFGWGRSDKGQLGCHEQCVPTPRRIMIEEDRSVTTSQIACGSESSYVFTRDNSIWSCGWNEHGNLGVGTLQDETELTPVLGTERIVSPPTYADGSGKLLMAAGGAHFLVMKT